MPIRMPQDRDGRTIPLQVPTFRTHLQYVAASITEMGDSEGVTFTCPCDKQSTLPGMVHFGVDGRLTNPTSDPRFTDLALDHTFAACPRCGRVFHIESLVVAGSGGRVPTLARVLPSLEYTRARAEATAAMQSAVRKDGVTLLVWECLRVSDAGPSHVGVSADMHELARMAGGAHGVKATLTRLPDDERGTCYNVHVTSQLLPRGVNVVFTPEYGAGIEDLNSADFLCLFARNDRGTPGTTLTALLGELDAGFLVLDHAPEIGDF